MLIINQVEGWVDICNEDQAPGEHMVNGRPYLYCSATWGGIKCFSGKGSGSTEIHTNLKGP